jgi:hypothetical protein
MLVVVAFDEASAVQRTHPLLGCDLTGRSSLRCLLELWPALLPVRWPPSSWVTAPHSGPRTHTWTASKSRMSGRPNSPVLEDVRDEGVASTRSMRAVQEAARVRRLCCRQLLVHLGSLRAVARDLQEGRRGPAVHAGPGEGGKAHPVLSASVSSSTLSCRWLGPPHRRGRGGIGPVVDSGRS